MNHIINAERLLHYGVQKGFVDALDIQEVRNHLWRVLNLEGDLEGLPPTFEAIDDIYALLEALTPETLTYAYEKEMFQAHLMSALMHKNSVINRQFWELYQKDCQLASQWFYKLSIDSTYIRMDRVSKNVSWTVPTQYGRLDITINMSKPEKDPKEIALMRDAPQVAYPKCLLCLENVGYSGHVNHPARHQHKVIKMTLNQEAWYFQYSPYVYYNEHAIVFCGEHRPMKIDGGTFSRLLDFVDVLPHYFIGSNADLHTVGGSILTHDHYQAGAYEMPMMRAKTLYMTQMKGCDVEVLHWPLSVVKISGKDKEGVKTLALHMFEQWVNYTDEAFELYAHTDERHNTVTPIAQKIGETYVLFLALRNNRRTAEHPEGLFHPHREHHHIKKENIGLIEVMGLAVLPSRLSFEIEDAVAAISQAGGYKQGMFETHSELSKHSKWLDSLSSSLREAGVDGKVLQDMLQQEMGQTFLKAIENSGIFKGNVEGFKRYLDQVRSSLVTT